MIYLQRIFLNEWSNKAYLDEAICRIQLSCANARFDTPVTARLVYDKTYRRRQAYISCMR